MVARTIQTRVGDKNNYIKVVREAYYERIEGTNRHRRMIDIVCEAPGCGRQKSIAEERFFNVGSCGCQQYIKKDCARNRIKVGDINDNIEVISNPYSKQNSKGVNTWYVDVRCNYDNCGREYPIQVNQFYNLTRCFKHGTTTTHNLKNHRLYMTYRHMVARCTNKDHPQYNDYGGRGIKVCDEWNPEVVGFEKGIKNFVEWAEDKHKPGLTLDRKDNNGNYSPENCRYTTPIVQGGNKRDNVYYELFGERKILADWLRDPRLASTPAAVEYRLSKGWDFERAFTTPLLRKHKKYRSDNI